MTDERSMGRGDQLEIEPLGDFRGDVQPEVRLARLRRDIQQGLATERTWTEYCELSIEANCLGEAAKALRRITDPEAAVRLTRMLEERGVHVHGMRAQSPPGRKAARRARPAGPAPARGKRPEKAQPRRKPDGERRRAALEGPGERLVDAIGYLFVEHMPAMTLLLVLMFPAAAAASFLHPAPAMPVLDRLLRFLPSALAVLCALSAARRVFEASATGAEDAPSFAGLLRGAPATAAAAGALGLAAFAPGALALLAGFAPWVAWLLFAAGALWLPIAAGGLLLGRNFDSCLPNRVFATFVTVRSTALLPGLVVLAGLPPFLFLVSLFAEAPIELRIGLSGPLFVLVALVAARLAGRGFYARRQAFARLLGLPSTAARAAGARAVPAPAGPEGLPAWDRRPAPPQVKRRAAARVEGRRPAPPPRPRWRPARGVPLNDHTHHPLERR